MNVSFIKKFAILIFLSTSLFFSSSAAFSQYSTGVPSATSTPNVDAEAGESAQKSGSASLSAIPPFEPLDGNTAESTQINGAPINVENSEMTENDSNEENTGEKDAETTSEASGIGDLLSGGPQSWLGPNGWFGPNGISASLKTFLALSVLSLAPAILLTTTSFVRLSVVLTLLRQAIGAGQVPSNQVITSLAIFLTFLIMAPVWTEVCNDAVVPYSKGEISDVEALEIGQAPIRTFLWKQIEKTGNVDAIWLFMRYIPDAETPQYYEDVPWRALAPAFLLSELKTAFLIGFQIFIPFLIIDIVVSCVLTSTGMMMLPPTVVSLPFKLALFVLIDGWTLVVKSLLETFAWSPGATG